MNEVQTGVLDALVQEVAGLSGGSRRPVVVMDVDDTLLSTDRRHIRILKEFAGQRHVRARYLNHAWTLLQLEPQMLRYSITDTARAAGIGDPELLAELRDFWFARFFTNDYLLADEPVSGAAAYCRELARAGAFLVYLTGRDETMKEGTLASFDKHGFPLPEPGRVELILKPRFDTPDLEFKTQALGLVEKAGAVAGAFENEPAHINLFRGLFPEAKNVFVDTKHSGRPVTPHPAVHWIRDYRREGR